MRWVVGDHTLMEHCNRAKRTIQKDKKVNRRIEKGKKVNRTGRSHHRGQGDKLHILSIRLMQLRSLKFSFVSPSSITDRLDGILYIAIFMPGTLVSNDLKSLVNSL